MRVLAMKLNRKWAFLILVCLAASAFCWAGLFSGQQVREFSRSAGRRREFYTVCGSSGRYANLCADH